MLMHKATERPTFLICLLISIIIYKILSTKFTAKENI